MEYWNMCESQRFLLIAREGMSPYYKTAAKRFLCVYKMYIYIYIFSFPSDFRDIDPTKPPGAGGL